MPRGGDGIGGGGDGGRGGGTADTQEDIHTVRENIYGGYIDIYHRQYTVDYSNVFFKRKKLHLELCRARGLYICRHTPSPPNLLFSTLY